MEEGLDEAEFDGFDGFDVSDGFDGWASWVPQSPLLSKIVTLVSVAPFFVLGVLSGVFCLLSEYSRAIASWARALFAFHTQM